MNLKFECLKQLWQLPKYLFKADRTIIDVTEEGEIKPKLFYCKFRDTSNEILYTRPPDNSLEVAKLLSSGISSFNTTDQNKFKIVYYSDAFSKSMLNFSRSIRISTT